MMPGLRWFDYPDHVLGLAFWLREQGRFGSVDDVLYYFEKPWKWEDEWQERSASAALEAAT